MNSKLKPLLRDWLPPVAIRALKKLLLKSSITFTGPYNSWEEAAAASSGYDCESILEKVKDATLKVKSGDAAYERDSVVFEKIQYSWPVATGLMWAASQNNGCLSVVDFGGSLGSSYFQNRQFLDSIEFVRWSIIEQKHFVDVGQQIIQDDRLVFYESIESCLTKENPNVILISSVLQYLEKPFSIIQDLLLINPSIIILDLTIVNSSLKNKVYVQQVPPEIYLASYPSWSLSEKYIISQLQQGGYDLISDFETIKFPALQPIHSKFKGFLFKKRKA